MQRQSSDDREQLAHDGFVFLKLFLEFGDAFADFLGLRSSRENFQVALVIIDGTVGIVFFLVGLAELETRLGVIWFV